jgi:hypothetical protein
VTDTRAYPVFYKQPAVLAAGLHGAWRLLPGDAAFAADEPALALTPSEFAQAARSYPIVFTAGTVGPVALLGLDRANLFLEGGDWAEGVYVPAYVRRYPFILVQSPDRPGAGLAVDAASALVAKGGSEGWPLFEGEAPSATAMTAFEFCRQYNADYDRGLAFSRALVEEGLLVDRRVDAQLPNGRQLAVSGLQVVDAERFAALADDKVVAWHRNGWLGLVHHHLASLERLNDLLLRQGRRETEPAPDAPATAKPAKARRTAPVQ